jgi:ketosteroid isomerase-like protein
MGAIITKYHVAIALLCSILFCVTGSSQSQDGGSATTTRSRSVSASNSSITGVYRIDLAGSDKLYSVVSGASSNLPFGEQQRFFIDLAVRLTPPDLLAIERRGRTISLASSRAPRITFVADGITQQERSASGSMIRTRALLSGESLTVSTSGEVDDSFKVTFEMIDGGRRLRVTRRLSAAQLNEPVVVRSVYDKISEVAKWDIYGEPESNRTKQVEIAKSNSDSVTPKGGIAGAEQLRQALQEWVSATNARDISRLVAFYAAKVEAFYLKRDVPRSFVHDERARAFRQAEKIEVRAEEPEIIFRDAGRAAIMRFRKGYATKIKGARRNGEVIQELRWHQTAQGWKIFSERDVKVIR